MPDHHDTPPGGGQGTPPLTAAEQFKTAVRDAGIPPPEDIVPTGDKPNRFATNGDLHDTAGWYVFHDDWIPAGAFGDWRTGSTFTWRMDIGRDLTSAEEAAHQARMDAARAARDADDAVRRTKCRKVAAARWIMGTPAPDDHPYLVQKGVKSHGLRIDRLGRLLVPITDDDGVTRVLQTIGPDGDKRYLSGMSPAGHYFIIGETEGSPLCIVEGYATGASIHEATGYAVAVAFDCGNLPAVARALRERYPDRRLILCADDDIEKPGNPGRTAAHAAAAAVGGEVALPDFGENRPAGTTDFNDLAKHRGLDAVRECIARAKAPAEGERLASVEIYVPGDPPRMRTQTDILIDIGRKVAQALFLGDDDHTYAVVRDRSEVWPIASKRFREWLRGCYYQHVGKGANANSLRDAVETIAAQAQFAGDKRKVFLRTAQADGKLYIDLTDDAWRVVEIDRDDWRVLDRSPVMFTRRGAPAPLPLPEHGGSLSGLWELLNVPEGARPLVAAWLLAALYPSGPYPILALQGEEGAAKTSTARLLRGLVDPSLTPMRAPTRDEKDFLVGCIGNWCVCIDNLSGMQPWMSDSLCRLSTGGGFAARTLYTDTDETIVQLQRPAILTGLDVGVVRGDLVSRTILLTLGAISDDQRLEEDGVHARFAAARPRIFGALLTGMAQALREKANVKIERKPRMADFARLAVAAETALGFKAGDFMRAYESNIRDASAVVLDTPVAQALIEFITELGTWEGTATDLLDAIAPDLDDHSRSASAWPKSGRGMASALTRLGSALRRVGIEVEHYKTSDAKRTRLVRLVCKVPAQPSESSNRPQPAWNAGSSADGSKASDDSTVRESGNRPKPSETISNDFNARDGSDGSDGSADTTHTRRGWKTASAEEVIDLAMHRRKRADDDDTPHVNRRRKFTPPDDADNTQL